MREHLPEAATIRWQECMLYGQLQALTVAGQRVALPGTLEQLANLEEQFIQML